jgi:hypothetical protein
MGVAIVAIKKAQVTVNNNRAPMLIDITRHRYLTLLQQERLYFSFSHRQLVII